MCLFSSSPSQFHLDSLWCVLPNNGSNHFFCRGCQFICCSFLVCLWTGQWRNVYMPWTPPLGGLVGFHFWRPLARFRNPPMLSEVNQNIIIKASTQQGLNGWLAEPLCNVNPLPQQNKYILIAIHGLIFVTMYAITSSKTAGQYLWRNNKNIKFYQLVLVLSHCLRKS